MFTDIEQINKISLPRWNQLPDLDLYMDQTLDFINKKLDFLKMVDQKDLLTKTMINNYVKVGIVSSPVKKRYSNKHLAYLVVVCILKQTFSIQEIANLIAYQIKMVPVDQAYDYFCEEFELAMRCVFNNQQIVHVVPKNPEVAKQVQNTILAVVYKLYAQNFIQAEK